MIQIQGNTIKKFRDRLINENIIVTEPLCVYGAEEIPDNSVPICSVDRCIAKSILISAVDETIPILYIGKDTLKGCCPGGMTYLGFTKPAKYIKYLVSTGNERFMGGQAEYLKASPELAEGILNSIGEIKPLNNYLIIQKCKDLKENINVKSIICFGNGEQIRNLGGLIHFRTINPFQSINMPFGPTCATFITYPTGMAANTPKETSFIGPVDPTGNNWFPENYMAISIPIEIALQMNEDLNKSFIIKRHEVAYPEDRLSLK